MRYFSRSFGKNCVICNLLRRIAWFFSRETLTKMVFVNRYANQNHDFPLSYVTNRVFQRFFDNSRGVFYDLLMKLAFFGDFLQKFSLFLFFLEIKPWWRLEYLGLGDIGSLKILEICIYSVNSIKVKICIKYSSFNNKIQYIFSCLTFTFG